MDVPEVRIFGEYIVLKHFHVASVFFFIFFFGIADPEDPFGSMTGAFT